MPSTMTHSYFACDIYNKLATKNKVSDIENLKLYAQGTDPLMFYNYFVGKKNNYYCNCQYIVHSSKTRDYFKNIIKYIVDNDLTDNKELITFLYGNICHYFLDLWVHPFIYYKTGQYNKSDKNTYKYNALHQDMEYSLDKYLIRKRSGIKVSKFKIYKEIFDNYNISDEVLKCLDVAMKKTYGFDNIGMIYKRSVKMMKRFFYFFNYDRFGIKKIIYSFVDFILPPSIINTKELSFYTKEINMDYLNLDRKKWNHPAIKSEVYNYSFDDLYELAFNYAMEAIMVVNQFMDDKKIDMNKFNKIFKDLSYVTGKECHLDLELKYFEF